MKKILRVVLFGTVLAANAARTKLVLVISVGKNRHLVHCLGAWVVGADFWWPIHGRILNSRGSFYIPIRSVLANHLATS